MPFVYLFMFFVLLAVHPGLILLALAIYLMSIPGRRANKVQAAGAEMMLFGTSATDRAVLAGRRRL